MPEEPESEPVFAEESSDFPKTPEEYLTLAELLEWVRLEQLGLNLAFNALANLVGAMSVASSSSLYTGRAPSQDNAQAAKADLGNVARWMQLFHSARDRHLGPPEVLMAKFKQIVEAEGLEQQRRAMEKRILEGKEKPT